MRTCNKCGAPNVDEALFCEFCKSYISRFAGAGTRSGFSTATMDDIPEVEVEVLEGGKWTIAEPPKEQSEIATAAKPHPRKEPKNAPPPDAPAKNRVNRILVSLISLAMIVLGTIMTVRFFLDRPPSEAHELFYEGEAFYGDRNLAAARRSFQQFISTYPDNPLSDIAHQRIENIDALVETQGINDEEILDWLIKANKAYSNGLLLGNGEDDAFFYISKILHRYPDHYEALALKFKMITELDRLSNLAIQANNYGEAKGHLEKILKIFPDDEYAGEQLKYVNQLITRDENLSAGRPVPPVREIQRPAPRRSNTIAVAATPRATSKQASLISDYPSPRSATQQSRQSEQDWDSIKPYLQPGVKVVSEATDYLVLFHPSRNRTLSLGVDNQTGADLIAMRQGKWRRIENRDDLSNQELSYFFRTSFRHNIQ